MTRLAGDVNGKGKMAVSDVLWTDGWRQESLRVVGQR